ncbi:hypothetical protein [Parafrankia sp. Ea1.12]|uniref:non-homologous end-joining DNA ligase LigD n=1 Tax=Parafrankia sp. Ea1.12 TaxID=573499 RepID=UPI0034CFA973
MWAANFGALEWHAWTSTVTEPRQPSYALIDLDPGTETSWADVLASTSGCGPVQGHHPLGAGPAGRRRADRGRADGVSYSQFR